MVRGKWLPVAAAVILGAVAAGVMLFWRHQRTRAATGPAVSSSLAAPFARDITLSGTVQARHVALVGAPVEGSIEEFLVEVGDEVTEGQLLARISNARLESEQEKIREEVERAAVRLNRLESELSAARLEASRASADRSRARSELERARKAHLRQKLLYGEGATPRLVYERTEREFQAAETEAQSRDEVAKVAEEHVSSLLREIETARRLLDDKNREIEDVQAQLEAGQVLAPVDGLVVGRRGLPGDSVTRDVKDLFQIAVDLSSLSVSVAPDPAVAAAIRTGMPAFIQIAELGGETLQGEVASVEGNHVKVDFASPAPVVKPGMSASVRILLR